MREPRDRLLGMRPIPEACYWMASNEQIPEAPLEEDLSVDFAIIGGGLTGLWSALFLKELESSIETVVLERKTAGFGGSGRNAGILVETLDHSHSHAVAHFGIEEARKLAEIGRQNLEEMTGFLAANNLECDLERTGRFLVALSPTQLEEAKRSMDIAFQLGVSDLRLLTAEEMQMEIHSPLYLGGIYSPHGATLDPIKLVNSLKKLAIRNGIRIFENTPVNRFAGAQIRTAAGTVTARKAILATDAFTHSLVPKLLKYFIPLYDYIIVSAPLTSQQRASIGWHGRQGVADSRTFFNYYRLTSDDRILFGTSEAMYYPPNRVDEFCDHSETHYAALLQSFRRHFPQLSELQFPYAWGGPIASTTRFTPFFGSLENGRILYGLGYTGHGLGSTRMAGKILAHLALDRPSELFDLTMVRKKPFPYPPEPLRKLAVEAVTRSLRRVDDGGKPGLLLRMLDRFGIGFSS